MEDEAGIVVGGQEPPAPRTTDRASPEGQSTAADAAQTPKELQKNLRGRSVKEKKQAKKTGKTSAKKFRISRFDLDLLELVSSGKTSSQELLNVLLVAPSEFENRVKQLVRRDFLVREKTDSNVLRLGIDGYNFLREKETKKKQAEEAKQAPVSPAPASQPVSLVSQELDQLAKEEKMLPSEIVESRANLPPVPKAEPKEERVDLDELFKKGRPKERGGPKTPEPRKSEPSFTAQPVQQPPASPIEAVVTSLEKETQSGSCELCRAGFKLSLNPSENNPKYAHCFCGAAYHKDCYESIREADGKCVACGRKMKFSLDRHAEDAVKKIRNLFD